MSGYERDNSKAEFVGLVDNMRKEFGYLLTNVCYLHHDDVAKFMVAHCKITTPEEYYPPQYLAQKIGISFKNICYPISLPRC